MQTLETKDFFRHLFSHRFNYIKNEADVNSAFYHYTPCYSTFDLISKVKLLPFLSFYVENGFGVHKVKLKQPEISSSCILSLIISIDVFRSTAEILNLTLRTLSYTKC